jgi:hypothetical protein
LAAALWIVVSILFSWYAANFGAYKKTYGSLSAVVGFMTWMWISCMVILAGAEVDAVMERLDRGTANSSPPIFRGRITTARAPTCRGSGRTSFACSAGRPPALQAGHMFWPDFPIRLSRLGFVPVTRGFGHLRPSACIVQLGSFGELRSFVPCVNPLLGQQGNPSFRS